MRSPTIRMHLIQARPWLADDDEAETLFAAAIDAAGTHWPFFRLDHNLVPAAGFAASDACLTHVHRFAGHAKGSTRWERRPGLNVHAANCAHPARQSGTAPPTPATN